MPNGLNVVRCHRNGVDVLLNPRVTESVGPLERFWAFLTIKQLLEKSKYSEDGQNLKKRALELALKYSFVTEVTSLVVVKPEEKAAVDLENASTPDQQGEFKTEIIIKRFLHVAFRTMDVVNVNSPKLFFQYPN